jgi:hypothetical protein
MAAQRRRNLSEIRPRDGAPMPPSEGPGPEIGLTGARFGGASRKRRKADPFPVPAAGPPAEPDVPGDPIGLTGARFGGTARRRGPAAAAPRSTPEPSAPEPPAPGSPAPPPRALWPALPAPAPGPDAAPPAEPLPAESPTAGTSTYALVRPYVLTGGRTRAGVEFAVEALLTAQPGPPRPGEPVEHTRIRGLCGRPRSVAEVAALVGFPLGVVRVLLADMHAAGAITVHRTADAGGPDLALMERVLAGLRRL